MRWFQRSGDADHGDDPGQFDAAAVEATIKVASRMFGPGRYFGLDARGFENVPDAPAMIVSNHSGGTTIPDVWGFGVAWYRHFGTERPVHPLAHEIIMSTRATARFFGRRGVLRATRGNARKVLTEWKRDVMVMPGGDRDTWRPYSKRYQLNFAGRTGYARVALESGVPIVPVANAGAHETLFVLSDGHRVARALQFQKRFRAGIFPVHFSLPWGLTVGPWPHLPWPANLRYRIGPPIYPDVELAPGEKATDEMVIAHDLKVRCVVQTLLRDLEREAAGERPTYQLPAPSQALA